MRNQISLLIGTVCSNSSILLLFPLRHVLGWKGVPQALIVLQGLEGIDLIVQIY